MLRLTLCLLFVTNFGFSATIESFDQKTVAKIRVSVETTPPGHTVDTEVITESLSTKIGDPFSQMAFDRDLKSLSEKYERVDPTVTVRDGEVYISLKLWEKPYIRKIKWMGNKRISTKKLASELDIKQHSIFNRDEFNKAFNKVKEYYIKKGFFEAQLGYRIIPIPRTNEVTIDIEVKEGRSARIKEIEFEGFSSDEESDVLHMINTKKYNIFTSWLTGNGIYHQDALEHDKLTIVNYLQNEGYADAHVSITLRESITDSRIIIMIKAEKGKVFHFGTMTFTGNVLFSETQIEEKIGLHPGDIYSPERIRSGVEQIKSLYGQKGHIETTVHYELRLSPEKPEYNVHFTIEESEQFKIGVIRILGNTTTNSSVILNESLLVPGEIFDDRKLKATQQRLETIGYFKSVNVYAVRNSDDYALGPEYRDVVIEVEETLTGSLSMFFGFSSTDSIFGGLDMTENNFDAAGLLKWWRDGASSFRGGGQYAQAQLSVGRKLSSVKISWLTPYLNDTLWRFGFDATYSINKTQSKDFRADTFGGTLYASHPITNYWNYGMGYRFDNTIVDVKSSATAEAKEQHQNSGIVTGYSMYLPYDSTDNPMKPHRGIRSTIEGEIAVTRRHASTDKVFPFLKFSYVNSLYYPIWKKGTMKFRGDLRALQTLGKGEPLQLPTNERFYLGGEATVRGYKPAIIGPTYNELELESTTNPTERNKIKEKRRDATGGATSALISAEYNQYIIQPLDAFVFFDAGAISLNEYDVGTFRMSYGTGVRINIAGRMPMTFGIGFPINPASHKDKQKFFFAMGGQF